MSIFRFVATIRNNRGIAETHFSRTSPEVPRGDESSLIQQGSCRTALLNERIFLSLRDLCRGPTTSGKVPRGEMMLHSGTDPESFITEYTIVYEDQVIRSEVKASSQDLK